MNPVLRCSRHAVGTDAGQELLDLTIAVASLREQIESDPTIEIDPADVRDRLGAVAARFREHQVREVDLVYETIGRELDER